MGDNVTVYYDHGQVIKLIPDPGKPYYEARGIINSATAIVSDGIHYDLTDRRSIYSIQIPNYTYFHENPTAQNLGVTGFLDYVLRMHAGELWNNGDRELSMACLEKACQLMVYSTVGWQRKDFFRVVNRYIELGRFKKAKEWRDWIIRNTTDPDDYAFESFQRTVESCNFLGTDFVEVGSSNACCEVCAKYRNRIYSISGASRKFPRFPSDFHFQCGLPISPFVLGVSTPSFRCVSYVLHSNRPFKDGRTSTEKENYKVQTEALAERKRTAQRVDLNRITYYWFKPLFPSDFPKSVSAFSRAKNTNSKKYQELIKKIESAGYSLPTSLDEVAEWEADNSGLH